jgi:triacylglycerol lipase
MSFALAWWWRSPRPVSGRIGLRGAIGLFVREWRAFTIHASLAQAFDATFAGPDVLRRLPPGELPVLLIHGFACNRGAWWWLKPQLERAGYCVASVTLEPLSDSIDAYVPQVSRRIDEICSATGAQRVTVIAHSMGGLVARALVRNAGAQSIARVVTLGTPHQGSMLAWVMRGTNARQMRPGDPWLVALNKAEWPSSVPLVSIYSLHDNLVAPQDNAILAGAQLIPMPALGHHELVSSQHVLHTLLDLLGETPLPDTPMQD